jgi:hypothetical protein
MAPLVLDTFHMPLVDQNYNFLSLSLVNLGKQFIVFLVNKNLLKFREENVGTLNVPIQVVLV